MAGPAAAYGASLYVSGTSTADAGEACSAIGGSGANQIYQVTSTAKRAWDPTVAIVVKDGTTTLPASDYVFDYTSGVIQFVAYTPVGAITVTGNYLPLYALATASEFELDLKTDSVDVSVFGVGAHQKQPTLSDADGTLSVFDPGDTVLDGGTLTLESILSGGKMLLLQIGFGAGLNSFRAFVVLDGLKDSAKVADVIKDQVAWKLADQAAVIPWSFQP